MIDITGVNLVEFVKKAYELSSPQGYGFLHFNPDPLSDDEANQIIANGKLRTPENVELSMDYVNGRAVKMTVFKLENQLQIRESWYDHTPDQLQELLSIVPKQ